MTLNDPKQCNGRYFALFHEFGSFAANYVTMVKVILRLSEKRKM